MCDNGEPAPSPNFNVKDMKVLKKLNDKTRGTVPARERALLHYRSDVFGWMTG